MFWTPAFAGVTLQETFYEIISVQCSVVSGQLLVIRYSLLVACSLLLVARADENLLINK
jgi:hypothetical protein